MRRPDAILPYLLVLPGLVLAAMIVIMPLYQLSVLSLSDVNRFGVPRGLTGFDNYTAVFNDPEFGRALWRTAIWTVGIVGGTVILSFPIALILNEDFAGRGLARIIIMLPWAMSLTMMAIVWRWALNGESGMLNSALIGLGIIDRNVQWLAQSATAFPVQIGIGILVSIPFTVTIFLGGLASIPDDLYEAGKLEGANGWQNFRELTWPLMRPFVNIAVVLNTIYVFNSFPIIWATTQGGPANSTDILVTYLYKLGFRLGKLGEAAALSLLMFVFLLALTVLYVFVSTRRARAAEAATT
jgi:multiple sugar transport system permease protein